MRDADHETAAAKPLTRRDALRRLGAATCGTLFGVTALLARARSAVAAPAAGTLPTGGERPLPQTPVVRTLLGDFAPDALPDGAVLFHEHLSFKYPRGAETHATDDVDLMVEEVRAAQEDGLALIVDGGHPDMERDLDTLRRIARETGMPVVASGGYYMQSWYPPHIARMSAEAIADSLVAEAERDGLGAYGEIGQQEGELTEDERKVFRAVGLAQARTGLPVFTHNPYSVRAADVPRDAALRQLDILEDAGADPGSLAIGHVCCLDDPAADVAVEIARRGAYVGFDRVTLNFTMPDEDRVRMAMALVEAGHANRLLLSSDFYSGATLKANGGPGLAQAVTVFAPMLLEAGLPEATLDRILVENPRRFLSFTPRRG